MMTASDGHECLAACDLYEEIIHSLQIHFT
jgi:hypothetical protein